MAEIPSLRRLSCLVTVQALLDIREDSSTTSALKLIQLFQTDSYTAVSGSVLLEVLENFAHKISDTILLCLVPPHTKQLKLSNCSQLTSLGVKKFLQRCRQLVKLDLHGCDQLLKPTFCLLMGRISGHMTSINLGECNSANDPLVKILLRSSPGLKHLGLPGCSNVTDDAFLLDKAAQLRSSVCAATVAGGTPAEHKCSLTSIDVSCCKKITSTGIRNITSLCGSSLQHVNISYTKADCLSLLYLSGFTMYSALKVAMAADHTDNMTAIWKTMHASREHKSDHQDVTVEDIEELEENEAGSENEVNGSSFGARNSSVGTDNVISETPSSFKNVIKKCSLHSSLPHSCDLFENCDCEKSMKENKDEIQEESESAQNFTQNAGKTLEKTTYLGNENAENETVNMSQHTGSECCMLAGTSGTFRSDPCRCESCDISGSTSTHSGSEKELGVNADHTSHPENYASKMRNNTKATDCVPHEHFGSDASTSNDKDEFVTTMSPVSNRLNGDRSSLYKCIQGKLGMTHKHFDSQLISLEIEGINYPNVELGEACLTEFFGTNTTLENFSISWGDLSDTMISYIAKHSTQLESLSLVDCDSLSTFGVADLCMKCPDLISINLQGVCFFGDVSVLPLITRGRVRRLNLAESNVTDLLLRKIAACCSDTLEELDLSWCEEIGIEDCRSLNELVSKCRCLRKLVLRQCQVDETTVATLSDTCTSLKDLNLSSVNCINDSLLVALSMRLRQLSKLDISWNSAITDIGMNAILTYCTQLQEGNFAGIKQITSDAFLPIISNVHKWKRSQALFRLKLHEKRALDDHFSSDEEFEDLYLPHRSIIYATRLKWLDLEYCDQVNDTQMAEIVAVCRGTLKVRDYYGQIVKPCWISCRKGQVYLQP